MSISQEAYKEIAKDFINIHKAFAIMITLVSVIINIVDFLEGRLLIQSFIITIFWICATAFSLFKKFRIHTSITRNSKLISTIIYVDYLILNLALLITSGKIGVFPYALAFLLLFTVLIESDKQSKMCFGLFVMSIGIYYIQNMSPILSYFDSNVELLVTEQINHIRTTPSLKWIYPVLQIVLLAGLIRAAIKVRKEFFITN